MSRSLLPYTMFCDKLVNTYEINKTHVTQHNARVENAPWFLEGRNNHSDEKNTLHMKKNNPYSYMEMSVMVLLSL